MREEKIIQFLANNPHPQSLTELSKAFGVSKRTLANDLKSLNSIGNCNGFTIDNIRGKGYKLSINDAQKFSCFVQQMNDGKEEGIMNPQSRKVNIELLLLFANDYVTIHQIAETLDVSPSTIKNDLPEVKQDFESMHLSLRSKAHYGYQVTGAEENQRLFIIQLLRKDISQPKFTKEFAEFSKYFDIKKMKAFLTKQINELQIRVNDLGLENLVQHIFLLVFRIRQHNSLKIIGEPFVVKDSYTQLTERIAKYIEANEEITLADNEKRYLSSQLFGKIVVLNDQKQHQELLAMVDQALVRIDQKYQTLFHKDQELSDALTLHVAPLLQRLYVGRQLENPIIDDVYTRYANVFNIAFEFIDEISVDAKTAISKDEAGYLAIYFAASLEKQLQEAQDRYHKIAVICATGGGASYFVKTRLEQIFANATVHTYALIEANQINPSYDLIITTVPIKRKFDGIPMIKTHALLTDKEITKIQQALMLIQENKESNGDMEQQLLGLFSKENFTFSNETHYFNLLKKRSQRLENEHWASAGYTELVVEREKLVDTIYEHGVAGPHPMESRAKKECIDIILCTDTCKFREKTVKIIFLINISNNHLFLHKEISWLMIKMMDDPELAFRLENIKNFDEFFFYIKELIKKG